VSKLPLWNGNNDNGGVLIQNLERQRQSSRKKCESWKRFLKGRRVRRCSIKTREVASCKLRQSGWETLQLCVDLILVSTSYYLIQMCKNCNNANQWLGFVGAIENKNRQEEGINESTFIGRDDFVHGNEVMKHWNMGKLLKFKIMMSLL